MMHAFRQKKTELKCISEYEIVWVMLLSQLCEYSCEWLYECHSPPIRKAFLRVLNHSWFFFRVLRSLEILHRKFTGKDPVSILYFLERFVSTCNAFDVSEGNALWLLFSYMDKAAHSYITQTMGTINDIDNKQPRIVLCISVVQQLLDRYAGDQVLTVTNN